MSSITDVSYCNGYVTSTTRAPLGDGVGQLPDEVLVLITNQLREWGDVVASMRYLAALGRSCRHLGQICFSKPQIVWMLSTEATCSPTIPFPVQLKLTSYSADELARGIIYNTPQPIADEEMKQLFNVLPLKPSSLHLNLEAIGEERRIKEIASTWSGWAQAQKVHIEGSWILCIALLRSISAPNTRSLQLEIKSDVAAENSDEIERIAGQAFPHLEQSVFLLGSEQVKMIRRG